MKVSILIPTCYRPTMFSNMLDSLEETTVGYEIETIAVVDEDFETKKIADSRCTISSFSATMRGALYGWNHALKLSTGSIIVPAGDDQLFYPHWLDYALESHRERLGGYGVVGMNDLAYDGNLQLATMFLFDRKYCQEVMGGIFAPPMYRYFCIDSEWNAKAKSLGRFWWDSRAVVEHLHSAHLKRPIDQHDLFRMDEDWMELDNKTFADRLSANFPVTWASLI